MNESGSVFYTSCICYRVRTVQSQVEVEVREVFFQSKEVFQIEYFVQCTSTVEVVQFAVCSMQCTSHMHNLCTKRSHTGTTTDPNHFFLRIEDWVEVSVRTTHQHLVTRFQSKDVRRSDTRIYIHKSATVWFERRSSDTYCQHEHVTFCRIVGHRVSTDSFFRVLTFQAKQTEFFPSRQIFVTDKALINVLVVIHFKFRNLNLSIRTRDKVHVSTFRQLHFELFDKSSHVLV